MCGAGWSACQPDVLLLQEIKCEAHGLPRHGLPGRSATGPRWSARKPITASPCSRACRSRSRTAPCPACPTDDAQARYIEIDGRRHHRHRHLPAERQFRRRGRLRLQARLDGPAGRARRRAAGGRHPLRDRRRLQRLPDRRGLRPRRAAARRRAGAARNPRPLPPPALARPDRRHPRAASAAARSTRSGTTRPAPGSATAACASTTRCCPRRSPSA